jgi:hypothetical protein
LVSLLILSNRHFFNHLWLVLPQNLIVVVLAIVQVKDISWNEALTILVELLETQPIDVIKGQKLVFE